MKLMPACACRVPDDDHAPAGADIEKTALYGGRAREGRKYFNGRIMTPGIVSAQFYSAAAETAIMNCLKRG